MAAAAAVGLRALKLAVTFEELFPFGFLLCGMAVAFPIWYIASHGKARLGKVFVVAVVAALVLLAISMLPRID